MFCCPSRPIFFELLLKMFYIVGFVLLFCTGHRLLSCVWFETIVHEHVLFVSKPFLAVQIDLPSLMCKIRIPSYEGDWTRGASSRKSPRKGRRLWAWSPRSVVCKVTIFFYSGGRARGADGRRMPGQRERQWAWHTVPKKGNRPHHLSGMKCHRRSEGEGVGCVSRQKGNRARGAGGK